jgi:RNA recognition motif-containing protein
MKVSPIIILLSLIAVSVLVWLSTPIMTQSQLTAFIMGIVITYAVLSLTSGSASNSATNSSKPSQKKSASSSTQDITTLYIGNLAYKVSEKEIQSHFAQHGYVDSVRLMKDRKTGRRKGFGFVEVASADAQRMIDALNDTEFSERTLKVRLAKEKGND